MRTQLKPILAGAIIATTFGVFALFVKSHPEVIHKIGAISLGTLIALLAAFSVAFIALALILRVSLMMYGKTLTYTENLLLNAYSSLMNFFGPGQTGPAL